MNLSSYKIRGFLIAFAIVELNGIFHVFIITFRFVQANAENGCRYHQPKRCDKTSVEDNGGSNKPYNFSSA